MYIYVCTCQIGRACWLWVKFIWKWNNLGKKLTVRFRLFPFAVEVRKNGESTQIDNSLWVDNLTSWDKQTGKPVQYGFSLVCLDYQLVSHRQCMRHVICWCDEDDFHALSRQSTKVFMEMPIKRECEYWQSK